MIGLILYVQCVNDNITLFSTFFFSLCYSKVNFSDIMLTKTKGIVVCVHIIEVKLWIQFREQVNINLLRTV